MSEPRPVTDEEYGDLLATFKRSAFKLETRDSYAIGEERADFEQFLAGSPRPPDQTGWWKRYLDQSAEQARQGKARSRVRVVDAPPTDYQRWLLWADPWYVQAGEVIRYLPRKRARLLGLRLDHDWWLLDDASVITTWFTEDGQVRERFLASNQEIVSGYRYWQDLSERNAVPAGHITAA